MKEASKLPDWMIPLMIRLEKMSPGFMIEYLQTSAQRRHLTAAILSSHLLGCFQDARGESLLELENFSYALRFEKTELLAKCFFLNVHADFLSILNKEQLPVMDPDFYMKLYRWLKKSPHPAKISLLSAVPCMESETIDHVEALDSAAATPAALRILKNCKSANILNSQILFIKAVVPEVSEKMIQKWLKHYEKKLMDAEVAFNKGDYYEAEPDEIFEFVLPHTKFAPPPFEFANGIKPLRNGRDMFSASRLMKNCLKRRVVSVILNEAFYYLVGGAEPLIIELLNDAPLSWRIGDIRGAENAVPSPEVLVSLKTMLVKQGVRDAPSWTAVLPL